jgi:hypothetical protein
MKVKIENIDNIIIMFKDPKDNSYRRIIFGDSDELLDNIVINGPVLFDRLKRMGSTEGLDDEEINKNIVQSRAGFEKDNHHGAFDEEKSSISITYEIKKRK